MQYRSVFTGLIFSLVLGATCTSFASEGLDFGYTVDGPLSLRPTLVFNDGSDTYVQPADGVHYEIRDAQPDGPYLRVPGLPSVMTVVANHRAMRVRHLFASRPTSSNAEAITQYGTPVAQKIATRESLGPNETEISDMAASGSSQHPASNLAGLQSAIAKTPGMVKLATEAKSSSPPSALMNPPPAASRHAISAPPPAAPASGAGSVASSVTGTTPPAPASAVVIGPSIESSNDKVAGVVSTPAEFWTMRKGKLVGRELERWAAKAGWTLVWQLPRDIVIPADSSWTGSFKTAATAVITTLRSNGALIHGKFYDGNNTLVVAGPGTQPQ